MAFQFFFKQKIPYKEKINYKSLKKYQELQKQGGWEILKCQRGEAFQSWTQDLQLLFLLKAFVSFGCRLEARNPGLWEQRIIAAMEKTENPQQSHQAEVKKDSMGLNSCMVYSSRNLLHSLGASGGSDIILSRVEIPEVSRCLTNKTFQGQGL